MPPSPKVWGKGQDVVDWPIAQGSLCRCDGSCVPEAGTIFLVFHAWPHVP